MTAPTGERAAVFSALKKILQPYAKHLTLTQDTASAYLLDAPYSEKWGKAVFFGGVRSGKAYVAFHLIAVYAFPELTKDMSPALRRRMQGKSCFNFRTVDQALFKELAAITKRGWPLCRKAGFL
jgi:hypothetical protein